MELNGGSVERRCNALNFRTTQCSSYVEKVLIDLAAEPKASRGWIDADKVDVCNARIRLGNEADQECLQLACLVDGKAGWTEVLEKQARKK